MTVQNTAESPFVDEQIPLSENDINLEGNDGSHQEVIHLKPHNGIKYKSDYLFRPMVVKITQEEYIQTDRMELLEEIADCGEHFYQDSTLRNSLDNYKLKESNREKNINEGIDADGLYVSGLIDKDEYKAIKETPENDPSEKILSKIQESGLFPENINISLNSKYLTVNEVKTNVRMRDIRKLYNGYISFTSKEAALTLVFDVIKEKLIGLFGRKPKTEVKKEKVNDQELKQKLADLKAFHDGYKNLLSEEEALGLSRIMFEKNIVPLLGNRKLELKEVLGG